MGKRAVLPVARTHLGSGSLLEPGLCLLCGIPSVFYDLKGNVIKREPVSLVYTYQVLFDSLCRCLAIRMGGRLRHEWDFSKEPFPFCESCEILMGSLVDLYRQVEQLENTVRNNGLKGTSKFIPISKFDERSQLFRNVIHRFDRRRHSGIVATHNDANLNQSQTETERINCLSFGKSDEPAFGQNNDIEIDENSFSINDGDECDTFGGDEVEVHEERKVIVSAHLKRLDSDCSTDEDDEWSPAQTSRSTPQPKKVKRGHQQTKSQNKTRKSCTKCSKTFRDNRDLENHMRSEHGMEKLKCDLCENSYCAERSLRNHKFRDHGIGVDGGDDDKSADPEEILESDASDEDKRAKLSRSISSTSQVDTENKLRSKSGHLRKTCKSCGRSCPNNRALYSHMRKEHGMDKIKCDMCPNEYCNQQSLIDHKASAHATGEVSQLVCHICAEVFLRKETLKEHVVTVHAGKYIIV